MFVTRWPSLDGSKRNSSHSSILVLNVRGAQRGQRRRVLPLSFERPLQVRLDLKVRNVTRDRGGGTTFGFTVNHSLQVSPSAVCYFPVLIFSFSLSPSYLLFATTIHKSALELLLSPRTHSFRFCSLVLVASKGEQGFSNDRKAIAERNVRPTPSQDGPTMTFTVSPPTPCPSTTPGPPGRFLPLVTGASPGRRDLSVPTR